MRDKRNLRVFEYHACIQIPCLFPKRIFEYSNRYSDTSPRIYHIRIPPHYIWIPHQNTTISKYTKPYLDTIATTNTISEYLNPYSDTIAKTTFHLDISTYIFRYLTQISTLSECIKPYLDIFTSIFEYNKPPFRYPCSYSNTKLYIFRYPKLIPNT